MGAMPLAINPYVFYHRQGARACPICHSPGCLGGVTADGLSLLCEVQLGGAPRSTFAGCDGKAVLYTHPNPDVLPPGWLDPPRRRPPDAPSPPAVDPRQLEEIRAERDRLARELAAVHGRIDVLETSEGADAVMRQQRRIDLLEAARRQIVAALTERCLTHAQRVITVLAMEAAQAYRVRPHFGDEVDPEPQHVQMGQLAQRAGVHPQTLAPALKAADAAGLITRTERIRRHELADGRVANRLDVFIGPGTGQAGRRPVDPRHQRERDRKKDAQARRAIREASLAGRVAELEAVASRAAIGCPNCGHELLPTCYRCPGCGHQHAPSDSTQPNPTESVGLEGSTQDPHPRTGPGVLNPPESEG